MQQRRADGATGSPPRVDAGIGRRIATVFLPFAFAYFLSFTYRTMNAGIADDLAADVGVGAASLGLLTGAYFIAFAAAQVPLGVLLDRLGPRRVDAALLVIAAAGAVVFAAGHDVATLAAGRSLIGLGVSACLMAALTANVMWWPRDRLPLVNGLFLAAGGLGAVFATTPVRALLTVTDWRGLFLGLSGATLLAAALLILVVPERRVAGGGRDIGELLRGMRFVYTSARFWRLAPAMAAFQGGFMAYLSLWAGPWLRDVEGLSRGAVAEHLQYTAIAMVAGFAGFGMIADRLRVWFGVPALTVSVGGMVLTLAVQAVLLTGAPVPPAMAWGLEAFAAGAPIMIFAILAQEFPPELAGRVNTATNLLSFMTTFAVQSVAGAIIALFPEAPGGGYAPEAHRTALLFVVAIQAFAVARLLWPRRPVRGSRSGSSAG